MSDPKNDTTTVIGWTLTCTLDRSSKFYNIFVLPDGNLVLHYGRIGTRGQTKVDRYDSAAEAGIVARRQVYAKASKGYTINADEAVFQATEFARSVAIDGDGYFLTSAWEKALGANEFIQRQRQVAVHYDNFITLTNRILDAASNGSEDAEALLMQWSDLAAAWQELDDKHEHAKTTVDLVQRVVAERLTGLHPTAVTR